MNYQETLDWMFVQLPMYQRQGAAAYKKDLSNTLLLVDHIGNPHKNLNPFTLLVPMERVSCSHMLASVLQEAGYKVGLYTSPHLVDFRERIKINGEEIPEENVIQFTAKNKSFFEENYLSFFEMTVGLAFEYFSEEKVDFSVVEVGLGGRLDSTNIITPEVSLITNIGLDHTQFLGDTLEKIALEKGGIIKKNIPVVIGEYQEETLPVFNQLAEENDAELFLASELISESIASDLLGDYQKNNSKSVHQTIKVLQDKGYSISDDAVRLGLSSVVKNTKLLGRWQVLQDTPKTICDTAHNKEGLTYTMKQLQKESYDRLHIVLGMVDDKDLQAVLPLFPKKATYYFCKPNLGRGLDMDTLCTKAKVFGLIGEVFSSVNEAYENASKNAAIDDCIYIGGSTFVVAEILQ